MGAQKSRPLFPVVIDNTFRGAWGGGDTEVDFARLYNSLTLDHYCSVPGNVRVERYGRYTNPESVVKSARWVMWSSTLREDEPNYNSKRYSVGGCKDGRYFIVDVEEKNVTSGSSHAVALVIDTSSGKWFVIDSNLCNNTGRYLSETIPQLFTDVRAQDYVDIVLPSRLHSVVSGGKMGGVCSLWTEYVLYATVKYDLQVENINATMQAAMDNGTLVREFAWYYDQVKQLRTHVIEAYFNNKQPDSTSIRHRRLLLARNPDTIATLPGHSSPLDFEAYVDSGLLEHVNGSIVDAMANHYTTTNG